MLNAQGRMAKNCVFLLFSAAIAFVHVFVSIRNSDDPENWMAGSVSPTERQLWEATPRSCESCMESPCDVSSLSEVYNQHLYLSAKSGKFTNNRYRQSIQNDFNIAFIFIYFFTFK